MSKKNPVSEKKTAMIGLGLLILMDIVVIPTTYYGPFVNPTEHAAKTRANLIARLDRHNEVFGKSVSSVAQGSGTYEDRKILKTELEKGLELERRIQQSDTELIEEEKKIAVSVWFFLGALTVGGFFYLRSINKRLGVG